MYLICVNLILIQYAILGPIFCIEGPKVLNLKKCAKTGTCRVQKYEPTKTCTKKPSKKNF